MSGGWENKKTAKTVMQIVAEHYIHGARSLILVMFERHIQYSYSIYAVVLVLVFAL